MPQNEVYLVLSEEERAKGFVRPVRRTYVHVGERFCEKPYTSSSGKQLFCTQEPGHEGECTVWTDAEHLAQRKAGCGTATTMGQVLAETYARDPGFYGATYCCGCQKHLAVAQFVWDGTKDVVGS